MGEAVTLTAAIVEAVGAMKAGGGGGAPHREGWQVTSERMLIIIKLERLEPWFNFFIWRRRDIFIFDAQKYNKDFLLRSEI